MTGGTGADPIAVAVVICCYTEDRWDDLCAAVESVRAQDPAPDRVVVVVDHNAALEHRARSSLHGVDVMPSAGRRGLSGARNTGVSAVSTEVVAFLDDDAIAEPGWLSALTAPYADPSVVATGGAALPAWTGDRPRWFPPEYDWVVGCAYRGLPSTTAPVRNVIGANMSFRTAVFAATGGFREGIGRRAGVARPEGCEETELCIRAAARMPGSTILYVPAARVHHHVPPERMTWAYFRRRCYAEGRSKARVVREAGQADGLRSERTHVAVALRQAVSGGLRDLVGRRDVGGLARSTAVLGGLAMAGAGFVIGLGSDDGKST